MNTSRDGLFAATVGRSCIT